jgi:shikimate kinase
MKIEADRNNPNIVLVGMPGAGKSTIGVILAKYIARDFVDTDLLIQMDQSMSLQQILDEKGYMSLRKIEEDILFSLTCRNHVIATGGSAAYSPLAMEHLKANGIIVFLDIDIDTLGKRVSDYDTRGIARSQEQTFQDLYEERCPLYKKYANIRIDCSNNTQEEIVVMIAEKLDLK